MCQDCMNPEDHDHLDDLELEEALDLSDQDDSDDDYDADAEAEADRIAMQESLSNPDPFDPE